MPSDAEEQKVTVRGIPDSYYGLARDRDRPAAVLSVPRMSLRIAPMRRRWSALVLGSMLMSAAGCRSEPLPLDASAPDSAVPLDAPGVLVARAQIGPAGGVLEGPGVRLEVPAGALLDEVFIQVQRAPASTLASDEHTLFSDVYLFEPAGLRFEVAARVFFDVPAAPEGAVVFWSAAESAERFEVLEPVEGAPTSGWVQHFSLGFVAEPIVATCLALNYGTAIDRTRSRVQHERGRGLAS